MSRIRIAVSAAVLLAAVCTQALAEDLLSTARAWESRLNARVGVLLRHMPSGWEISYRADERFPLMSTFKPLLCAAVLSRADAGSESLSAHVEFRAEDLVAYSPVTEKYLQAGLTVGQLCEAAVTRSDNTAANLLLERAGGPAGLTAYLRGIGDGTTRLDRWETELNEARPGDLRDTTTPRAMLASLQSVLFGQVLSPASAAQLEDWMVRDQLAGKLLRAHLPAGWHIGDKTGAGGHGSRAITAFLRDAAGETYLAAIYLTGSKADFSVRNQAVSDIGRVMIAEILAR
ncbi:class A beta-lactamase [Roseobacteraceae bacterium NS-SX3]